MPAIRITLAITQYVDEAFHHLRFGLAFAAFACRKVRKKLVEQFLEIASPWPDVVVASDSHVEPSLPTRPSSRHDFAPVRASDHHHTRAAPAQTKTAPRGTPLSIL